MLTKLHSFTAAGTLFSTLKINLELKGSYIKTFVYPVGLIKMFPSELFSIRWVESKSSTNLVLVVLGNAGALLVCLSNPSPQGDTQLVSVPGRPSHQAAESREGFEKIHIIYYKI